MPLLNVQNIYPVNFPVENYALVGGPASVATRKFMKNLSSELQKILGEKYAVSVKGARLSDDARRAYHYLSTASEALHVKVFSKLGVLKWAEVIPVAKGVSENPKALALALAVKNSSKTSEVTRF